MKKDKSTSRIRIISVLLVLFSFVIIFRLYGLQIKNGDEYRERADRQYSRPNANLLNRGSIFFSKKDGSLTAASLMKEGFIISIVPKEIKTQENAENIYKTLKIYIKDLDKESFFKKVAKKTDPYEEIAKKVSEEDALAIGKITLSGVKIYKDRWRFYPSDILASNAIGFFGSSGETLAGRYGLEKYYENILERPNSEMYSNIFAEFLTGIKNSVEEKNKKGDLVLTIEPVVQSHMEKVLDEFYHTWIPDTAGIIVMDPNNGEIISMATRPSFNPNNPSEVGDIKDFSNPLVESVFELGSIFKPITMAMALEEGVLNENTTYVDKGFVEVSGETIGNFDGKVRGKTSMQDVLNESLNTGIAFAVDKVGNNNFKKYFTDMGFREKTGVDLPSEAMNLTSPLDKDIDINFVTAAFGQGVALSPISFMRGFSAIINGGELVTPHLVRRIDYPLDRKEEIKLEKKKVLSTKTSDRINEMMRKVADDGLVRNIVKQEHYSIGVKTGTAQIIDRSTGKYHKDKYLNSFVGFFPSKEPKYLVLLLAVNPKGAKFASETLARPFVDIFKFMASYFEITPDR